MAKLNRLLPLLLLAFAGCVTDYKLVDGDGLRDGGPGDGDGDGDNGDGDGDGDNGGFGGVSGGSGAGGGVTGCGTGCVSPGDVCRRGGECSEIYVSDTDQLDLLFMVDNSNSMRDEQTSLAREFPNLINMLTSGDKTGDGATDFRPVKDLHLGVVSPDLGLPGVVGIEGCVGLGDEGILRSTANPAAGACSTTNFNPPFLQYKTVNGDDPAQLATDFACIATLGTDGCGFEQPLESMLKAVWPGTDQQVTFVPDPASGFGMFGNAGPGFPNGDFIRQDSIIGLVVVTDEEDCSSNRMDHFVPAASDTGLNTRCFFEGQRAEPNNLYDVERYIQTFKALRPGRENLVFFNAIVGVPPQLVTQEALSEVNFSNPDEANAFYDGLLAAPGMQETVDPRGNMDPADDNLVPSCDRGMDARAYPPRRIVEVAKGFGRNGVVQSICQEDFRPAINAIINGIASELGGPCLPNGHTRSPAGVIACDLVWADNLLDFASCDEPFLSPHPDDDRLCLMQQLPVRQGASGEMEVFPAPNGETAGFYYDDFSDDVEAICTSGPRARIEISAGLTVPSHISLYLDCD